MLGFRWMLDAVTGAPDDDDYKNAVDRLCDRSGQTMLQAFPKPAAVPARPSDALQTAIDDWVTPPAGNPPRRAALRRAVVMVHGFDYSVKLDAKPEDSPYNRVYALPGKEVGAPAVPESWLPIVAEYDPTGQSVQDDCAVAFGWESMTGFINGAGCLGNGFQCAALDVAPLAAKALTAVLLGFLGKNIAISMLAHSLGTRTAIQALRHLADLGATHLVDRVVLLEGSEFSVDAFDAMTRLPRTEFINIGNQRDDIPLIGTIACHPFRYNGTTAQRVIAHNGIDGTLSNLADLQINRGVVQSWAQQQNADYVIDAGPIPNTKPPGERAPHWAVFIHPGNRKFLRDMLWWEKDFVAWCRDTRAPFGFEHASYGGLAGVKIPAMPTGCQQRIDAINHGTVPQ